MQRFDMNAVIDGKRYDTRTAVLLADDVYWDGSNFERNGRNTWLYKSPKGQYFFVTASQWQGECKSLYLCNAMDARAFFEMQDNNHHVEYAQAFGEPVEG